MVRFHFVEDEAVPVRPKLQKRHVFHGSRHNQGLKEDPLNVIAPFGSATALLFAGWLADAQMEAYKILEFEENHPFASLMLVFAFVQQEKWAKALQFLEKLSSSLMPAIGLLAGVLKRMGEANRAEELIQELMPSQVYGAESALSYFYFICGEIDKAADWAEKAIKARNPAAVVGIAKRFRSSPRWLALARLMNLPEEARRPP